MNHHAIQLVTDATFEPMTLAEAKNYAHVDPDLTADDAMLTGWIKTARRIVEQRTGGHVLGLSTWRWTMDRFALLPNSQYSPGNPNVLTPVLNNTWPLNPSAWGLVCPRYPLVSVTSLQYYDVGGTLQTIDPANYIVDSDSKPARLAPTQGTYWPSVEWRPNAVQIAFTAGYADAAHVPPEAKLAMQMLIVCWYKDRDTVGQTPAWFDGLIDPLRIEWNWSGE